MYSYRKHIIIPEPPTGLPPEHLVSTLDDESIWTASDTTDRVITKNYSTRVVVCTPDIPYTYRAASAFTHYEVHDDNTHPEHLTAVLDAVEVHLEPADPTRCRYGIRFGDDQITSNTIDRLVEDVTHLQRHLTGLAVSDGGRIGTGGPLADPFRTGVAAIWPIRDGWFYLEGTIRHGRDNLRWDYGLLYPGRPIDATHIMSFFTECTGQAPALEVEWPERNLYATGCWLSPPLSNINVVDTELTDERTHLSGINPFYTGPTGHSPDDYADLLKDLYRPLRLTSTLLYEYDSIPDSDRSYIANEIIAVEPPTQRSLFVRARASIAV